MRSRAAVLEAPEKVVIWDVEQPPQLPGDAGGWLRVEACGVCGADVANYLGNGSLTEFGVALGHEIVGVVDELDQELAERWHVSAGARVLVEEYIPCFQCNLCRSGRYRRCERRRQYGWVPASTPPALWGGFADLLYLDPHSVLHPIPDGLDPGAATFAVPLSNGISWVHAAGAFTVGDSVAVLGPGQQGLACVLAAGMGDASSIVISGLPSDGDRLSIAMALGAHVAVSDGDDAVVGAVMDATNGRGADVVVDTTPNHAGALNTAVRCAAVGGRVVIAGLKRANRVDGFDSDLVLRKELTLRGVAGREPWAIGRALAWLERNAAMLPAEMAAEYDIDDTEAAIRRLGRLDGRTAPVHVVVRS